MKRVVTIISILFFLVVIASGCNEERNQYSKEEYPGQEMPKGVGKP
jgi:hypothetical protein